MYYANRRNREDALCFAIYPFGGARRRRSFHVGVGSLSQRRTAAGSIATEWFFLRVHCESGGRESPSGVSVGTCARTRLARLNRVRRSVVKSKRVRDLLSDDALPQKRHQPAVCCMRLGRPRGSELGRDPVGPGPGVPPGAGAFDVLVDLHRHRITDIGSPARPPRSPAPR